MATNNDSTNVASSSKVTKKTSRKPKKVYVESERLSPRKLAEDHNKDVHKPGDPPAKHWGNYKKSPRRPQTNPNTQVRHTIISNYFKANEFVSPKIQSIYLKYRTRSLNGCTIRELITQYPLLQLDDVLTFRKAIDFEKANRAFDPRMEKKRFDSPISNLNLYSGPKFTNRKEYLFPESESKSLLIDEAWWKKYSELHMQSQKHHTDYWEAPRFEKTITLMPWEDTLELLFDHFISALRISPKPIEAFKMSLDWLIDSAATKEKKVICVNHKFRKLCPHTVLMYILYAANMGFNDRNPGAQLIYDTTVNARSHEWSNRSKEEIELAISFGGEGSKSSYSYLIRQQNHPYKRMFEEIKSHIAGVDKMLNSASLPAGHDYDKTNGFMIACLSLKFLKFKPPIATPTAGRRFYEMKPMHDAGNRSGWAQRENEDNTERERQGPNPAEKARQKAEEDAYRKQVKEANDKREKRQKFAKHYESMFESFEKLSTKCVEACESRRICKHMLRKAMVKRLAQKNVATPTAGCNCQVYIIEKDCYVIVSEDTPLQCDCNNEINKDFYRGKESYKPSCSHMLELSGMPNNSEICSHCSQSWYTSFVAAGFRISAYIDLSIAVTEDDCYTVNNVFGQHLDLDARKKICSYIVDYVDDHVSGLDNVDEKVLNFLRDLLYLKKANRITRHLADFLKLVLEEFREPSTPPMLGGIANQASTTLTNVSGAAASFVEKITGVNVQGINSTTAEIQQLMLELRATKTELEKVTGTTAKDAQKAAKAVHDAADVVSHQVGALDTDSLNALMSSMGTSISEVTEMLRVTMNKINVFIPDFSKPFGFSIDSIKDLRFADLSACVILYILMINSSPEMKKVFLCALLYKLGIFHQVWKGLCYVYSLVFGEDEEEEEDPIKAKPTTSGATPTAGFCDFWSWIIDLVTTPAPRTYAIIAMVIVAGFVGHTHYAEMKKVNIFEDKVVKSMRDISMVEKGMSGMGRMFTYIGTGVTIAVKFIRDKTFGRDLTVEERGIHKRVENWLANVHFYSTEVGKSTILHSQSARDFARGLMPEGITYQTKCVEDTSLSKELMHIIKSGLMEAKKIYNFCHTADISQGGRIKPYQIMFHGPTGVGKSVLQEAVIDRLHKKYFLNYDRNKIVFPLRNNHGTEDWDGYTSQSKVVVLDDADAISSADQVALLIGLISNSPYIIPKAALEEKGMAFESEFLVGSTNSPWAIPPDVNYIAAYRSRRHAFIKVEPNIPDYEFAFEKQRKNMFSIELFKQNYKGQDVMKFPHLKFSIQNPLKPDEALMLNGSCYTEVSFEIMMDALMTDIEIKRINDPFNNGQRSQLDSERAAFITTIRQVFSCFDEAPRVCENLEHMRNVYFDNDAIHSIQPALLSNPDISHVSFTPTAGNSELEDQILRLKSKLSTRVPIHALKPKEICFDVDKTLVSYIDTIAENSSMCCVERPEDINTDYKDMAMSVRWYKYFTSYHELSKNTSHQIPPEESVKKGALVLRFKNINEAKLLFDPLFRGFLYRFTSVTGKSKIDFMQKELIPQIANRKQGVVVDNLIRGIKKNVASIFSGLWDHAKRFYRYVKDNLCSTILLVLAFGAAVVTLRWIARLLLGPEPTAAYNHHSVRHIPNIAAIPTAGLLLKEDHVQAEVYGISRNIVTCYDVNTHMVFHGLGVKGHMYMFPSHVFSWYKLRKNPPNVMWEVGTFPNYTQPKFVEFRMTDVYFEGRSDVCFVKLQSANMQRDISQKFMKDSDRFPAADSDVSMYTLNTDGKTYRQTVAPIKSVYKNFDYEFTDGTKISEKRLAMLKMRGAVGQSGAVICTLDPRIREYRIIGMASSTYLSDTYVACPTRETIARAEAHLGVPIIHQGPYGDIEENLCGRYEKYLDPEDKVDVVGVIPTCKQLGNHVKGEFGWSPIAGDFYVSKNQPAILHISDPRADGKWPLALSVGKRSRDNVRLLPAHLVEQATYDIGSEILRWGSNKRRAASDLLTAVTGRRDRSGYTSLNLKTSAGIPYVYKLTAPGKQGLISYTEEGEIAYISPQLITDIETTDTKLREGIILQNSLYDFPKDEIVSQAKIDKVKTRSITNSNLVYSILYRKYFMDFEALLHSVGKTGQHWYMVGVDPESRSWETFYTRLRVRNKSGWDFDISNWDGHFSWQLWKSFLDIVNRFYHDENGVQRESIVYNACYGYVQAGDFVYRPTRGMPSGFAGTTTANTIGNYLLFYVAYLYYCNLTGNTDYATYPMFKQLVAVGIYGDDITFTISGLIKYWFNGNVVAQFYERHGWPITMASGKVTVQIGSPEMIEGKSVLDLIFLKRGFRYDETLGFYAAPLNIDSIYDLVFYLRVTQEDPIIQFYNNLYTALSLVFHHGEGPYNDLLNNINSSLEQRSMQQVALSYPTYANVFLGKLYAG